MIFMALVLHCLAYVPVDWGERVVRPADSTSLCNAPYSFRVLLPYRAVGHPTFPQTSEVIKALPGPSIPVNIPRPVRWDEDTEVLQAAQCSPSPQGPH